MSNEYILEPQWNNYGDVNFIEHGGCLARHAGDVNCFEVIYLLTGICDYHGKYHKPCIIARCYVDTDAWMGDDYSETLAKLQDDFGIDYNPLYDRPHFAVDLVGYFGIQEFDPVFPKETGCGPYGFTWDKIIVGKTIAKRFMREYGVPLEWRS